jgi:hypothetical protein
MPVCVDEQSTRHHLGRWHGFGPVRNAEHVLFAVFPATKRSGIRLSATSFTRHLNNSTQSLARSSYVTRSVFDRAIAKNEVVDGVASAHVERIRKLSADIETPTGTINVRAMCVIDLVEPGDCDGHATMGYSAAMGGVSQKQIAKKRELVKMDLANTFSEITTVEEHAWPSPAGILPKRIASIFRALVGMI